MTTELFLGGPTLNRDAIKEPPAIYRDISSLVSQYKSREKSSKSSEIESSSSLNTEYAWYFSTCSALHDKPLYTIFEGFEVQRN